MNSGAPMCGHLVVVTCSGSLLIDVRVDRVGDLMRHLRGQGAQGLARTDCSPFGRKLRGHWEPQFW
jgi:hypothetical protein